MRVVWIPGHSATRVAGCRYPVLTLRVWPWVAAYIHIIYPRELIGEKERESEKENDLTISCG